MTDHDPSATAVVPARPRRTMARRAVVAVAVLGAVATAVLTLRPRTEKSGADRAAADRPEACLAALLMAERSGDVTAWRDCLAGPLRDEAERRLATVSEREFARALRSALADLKGHATTDMQWAGPDAARATVELIFADHNEREHFELRRTAGRWHVTSRSGRQTAAPPIPYGTPVAPD